MFSEVSFSYISSDTTKANFLLSICACKHFIYISDTHKVLSECLSCYLVVVLVVVKILFPTIAVEPLRLRTLKKL